MEHKRIDYLVTFSILSLAAGVLMTYRFIGIVLYRLADVWISNQEAGGYRWLSWLFHSPWTDQLVQYVFVLGASYLIIALILHWIPKFPAKPRPLSAADFMLCLIAAMGMGYVFNFIGNGLNVYIGQFTQKTLEEMNPVLDMASDLSPSMLIYSCLVAPFMEELLFRGMLFSRARVFGDRTAVFFTAALFGLMHGNLSQCLYGMAVGLILGYVAAKTNSIRYTVLMHAAINSYGTVMALGEEILSWIPIPGLLELYSLAFLTAIACFIVGAAVILWKYGRFWYLQLTWNNGMPSPWRKYAYLNPGFFLYFGICLTEILAFLL